MPQSTFKRPLPEGATPSRGYYHAKESKYDEVGPFLGTNSAYSLLTTAPDFAQFLSLVCRGKGLSAESYQEMLRIQTENMPDAVSPKRWRLGWEALAIKGREAVFHSGDNGNYMSMALFFPDNGEGYVVMTNGESGFSFINVFLREMGAGERSD